jgi:hypothetical protein
LERHPEVSSAPTDIAESSLRAAALEDETLILIVEDDELMAQGIANILSAEGHQV